MQLAFHKSVLENRAAHEPKIMPNIFYTDIHEKFLFPLGSPPLFLAPHCAALCLKILEPPLVATPRTVKGR